MSISDALTDIHARFLSAWPGGVVLWENIPGPEPEKDSVWCRVTVRHSTGGSAAIGFPVYEYGGTAFFQVFFPSGGGNRDFPPVITSILNAFRGVSIPNGVWYRNVRFQESGESGNWFQINVLVDFVYSEIGG